MKGVNTKEDKRVMPIMNVIKNDAYGNMLCTKIPCEDFNVGSQLIVAEYEEALFVKDGVVEEVFGAGKYTLTTENYPFLTNLMSKLLTGGVSAYSCKVYYINKSHHLELKWGTSMPIRCIDPVWGIEAQVQGRGAYSVVVKDSKKFFVKMVGANAAAAESDIVKQFRTAFLQHITDELFEYINGAETEIIVTCNRKNALAKTLTPILNDILDEYGLELVNFYIEHLEIPENDDSMQRIREMRILRQEKQFEREQSMADQRMEFGMRQESAVTDRFVSGQHAQSDYERMKIRDQDGNNGWARQEAAQIMKTMAKNGENGGSNIMAEIGMGIGMGRAMGNMAEDMFSNLHAPVTETSKKIICPSCNAVNPEGTKFCGSCGSGLIKKGVVCASCGAEIAPGMKFCGECGTPVTPQKKHCTNCGAEIAEGMKFCGECGNKVN